MKSTMERESPEDAYLLLLWRLMGHMWWGTQTRIPHLGCAHNKCGGEALSTTRQYINQVWMVTCSTSGSPVVKRRWRNQVELMRTLSEVQSVESQEWFSYPAENLLFSTKYPYKSSQWYSILADTFNHQNKTQLIFTLTVSINKT